MNVTQYIEAVKDIKEAILRSQYRAAASVNKEQLSLYYGIGSYVSANSRKGFWGKGAIEQISALLQKELPGLRGFSTRSIKNMRQFYEEWESIINRQPVAADLELDEKLLLVEIRQPVADEFDWQDFLSIGFSHHTEIIAKTKTLEERLFYIHECAVRHWSKYTLRDYLKADLYHHQDSYIRKPHENSSIGIILCREMNQTFVEFAVRDYNKPMGVATYRASEEMPERLRKALPAIEDLKKLL